MGTETDISKSVINSCKKFNLRSESGRVKKDVCIQDGKLIIRVDNEVYSANIDAIIKSLRKKVGGTYISKKKDTLLKLLNEIDAEYGNYSINDAANFLKQSKWHFSRYFHERTGILFSAYLNYVRVSKAVEIIKQDRDMPLKDVAQICGFSTMRNFDRVFKNLIGINPKSIPDDCVFDYKHYLSQNLQGFDCR